jgi:hypothetical protein
LNLEPVEGNVHLSVEVVDPELNEIAEDDIPRSARNETGPIVERLAVMAGWVFPAFLHLDENDGLPASISERRSLSIGLLGSDSPALQSVPRW